MSANALLRIAPGGRDIPWRVILDAFRIDDPAGALDQGLRARFPGFVPTCHASGREAMRVAFTLLAARSGRDEIALPAYACYSLAASAVAAGLRIRLIDVDARGRIDPEALVRAELDRVAALVVGNLFGVPEPMGPILAVARPAGVAVIDDAAQAIGASTGEGAVGARGDVGVLSFGRGKPISAMGGGALLWRPDAVPVERPPVGPIGTFDRIQALARAAAYDAARRPAVLRWLTAIPSLEIGVTRYDPAFRRGAIPRPAIVLAAALLPELDGFVADHRKHAEALAERIGKTTTFTPLCAGASDRASYPRLALVAPNGTARDRALVELAPFGATGMYPGSIARIDALRPHLVGDTTCPGGVDLAARLLTLPTHPGLTAHRVDRVLDILSTRGRTEPTDRPASTTGSTGNRGG